MDQMVCPDGTPEGLVDTRPELLIIDDDPTVTAIIEAIAHQLDFRVSCATDVGEALRCLAGSTPDVLILDLNLGHETGVDILEHVAEMGHVTDVILTSGCDIRLLRTTANLGRRLGLNVRTVLPKPIRLPSLRQALSTVPRRMLPLSVADIDRAIDEEAFCLFFQPQIDLETNQLMGAEALIRWRHPQRGLIMPATFVPLADQEGRLGDITEIVIEAALNGCRKLQENAPNLRISINIPPPQVTLPDFAQTIETMTRKSGLAPEQVVLEITESSPLTDSPDVISVLSRLRIKGFGLALDDFGTGYSSLIGLHRMPFSELKVDQSFVRVLRHDPDARVIVKATINMAHTLGLGTVVEGVEDAETLATIRDLGARIAQGFYYSEPLPPADFASWQKQFNTL